jgi:hypothetical protein
VLSFPSQGQGRTEAISLHLVFKGMFLEHLVTVKKQKESLEHGEVRGGLRPGTAQII